MKKFLAVLFTLVLMLALASCSEAKTMTYEEYANAKIDDSVVVEAYVQATQSWWENKITVYAQDPDGAYFIYEMACSEEDAAKLTPGTKIKVTGTKAEWAGEVEIKDATFKFVADAEPWVAEPKDVTALLGTDDLIKDQNKLVSFKGVTVKAVEFKGGEPGDDIYVTVTYNEADYSFCIERYLTAPDTFVYKTAKTLKAGDVIDVEGFLYWYEGVNTHITDIKFVSQHVMSHEEYMAADIDCQVTVETYVHAAQSWWDNKITVYAQSPDGAYFIYELACSEEDSSKFALGSGTKIKVTGKKAEWAGEIEIVDATFEFVADAEPWIVDEPKDATALLGTDELIDCQNELVYFEGLTVKKVEFKGGEPGDDIYVTVTYNEADYSFCVERYLTGPDSDTYKTVSALKAGDVISVIGFLYWYEGVNTHILYAFPAGL